MALDLFILADEKMNWVFFMFRLCNVDKLWLCKTECLYRRVELLLTVNAQNLLLLPIALLLSAYFCWYLLFQRALGPKKTW